MDKHEFYIQVANILSTPQSPNESGGYGRWRRGAGEGRYQGVGVIRWHSENFIHVMFSNLIKTYKNPQEALDGIRKRQNLD